MGSSRPDSHTVYHCFDNHHIYRDPNFQSGWNILVSVIVAVIPGAIIGVIAGLLLTAVLGAVLSLFKSEQ